MDRENLLRQDSFLLSEMTESSQEGRIRYNSWKGLLECDEWTISLRSLKLARIVSSLEVILVMEHPGNVYLTRDIRARV